MSEQQTDHGAFTCTKCNGYGDCILDDERVCETCMCEALSAQRDALTAEVVVLRKMARGPKPPGKPDGEYVRHGCDEMNHSAEVYYRAPMWWIDIGTGGVPIAACPFCGAWL